MRTTGNPGRFLEVSGSFALVPSLGSPFLAVVDLESGEGIGLTELLQWFLEDPSETITGPIRITIEAAS